MEAREQKFGSGSRQAKKNAKGDRIMEAARILIVEDDQVVVKGLEAYLTDLGHEVVGVATRGEEAVRKTRETNPDLVMMDIVLKGQMDGIEAAAEIRSQFAAPVVYLTAYTDTGILDRAKLTEPYGYLVKPITESELRSTIEMALHKAVMDERLRESEDRYRTLVKESFDGIFVQRDAKIAFANSRLYQMLGYEEGELEGMDHWLIYHPDYQDITRSRAQARMRGEAAPPQYEVKLQRKDGTSFDGEVNPKVINFQEEPGIQVWVRDITDRKKAEGLLVQAEKYKAVSDLASGVAHNFNNLLQIVLGNASLAQINLESGDLSTIKHNLKEITESSRFGAEVVRRLHSYAKGGTYKKVGEPEVFNLSDVVKQALEMTMVWWKTDPEKRGVHVSLNKDLEDDCLVKGDRNQLFEVLVNLIKNAAEAVSEGGDIVVASSIQDDQVVIKVQDTGIGIPEKDINRIFTPFFTTKFEAGTGLGLATSRKIVDAHGGHVLVDSPEGEGATVTVSLPLAEEVLESVGVGEEPAVVKPLTVLAIDDMEGTVTMLKSGLRTCHHVVFGALTGEEGLAIFKENPVDLVICDLGMPEMNGWQIGKAMKDFCEEKGVSKVPFIILTGWGDQSGLEEKIAESGVDAVVEKPVDMKRLMEVIREVVERQ